MTATVVIGLGNPWRRDDGVGHAVAEQVAARRRNDPGLRVELLDGEPARLLDAWTGTDLAVVIDAVRGGAVGTVRVVDPDHLPPPAASSHGLGLPAGVALGRRLDRLPGALVVVGVVGTDFTVGPGLSPAVAAAIPPAVDRVLRLVDGHTLDGGEPAPTVPVDAAVDPRSVAPGRGRPPGPARGD